MFLFRRISDFFCCDYCSENNWLNNILFKYLKIADNMFTFVHNNY